MEKEDYSLIMPFKDQSQSFAYGFQCGQIWELLKSGKKIDGHLFCLNNKEQVENMCQVNGYSFLIEKLDDTWCNLTGELIN